MEEAGRQELFFFFLFFFSLNSIHKKDIFVPFHSLRRFSYAHGGFPLPFPRSDHRQGIPIPLFVGKDTNPTPEDFLLGDGPVESTRIMARVTFCLLPRDEERDIKIRYESREFHLGFVGMENRERASRCSTQSRACTPLR